MTRSGIDNLIDEHSKLKEKYDKLFSLVKQAQQLPCNIYWEECLACEATAVLREIGEEK